MTQMAYYLTETDETCNDSPIYDVLYNGHIMGKLSKEQLSNPPDALWWLLDPLGDRIPRYLPEIDNYGFENLDLAKQELAEASERMRNKGIKINHWSPDDPAADSLNYALLSIFKMLTDETISSILRDIERWRGPLVEALKGGIHHTTYARQKKESGETAIN